MNQLQEALKNRIKELADRGLELRRAISASKAEERHAHWNAKRAVGYEARHALLVYAFVRGVDYHRVERHCHAGNEPQPCWLQRAAQKALPGAEWNPEAVETWLARRSSDRASQPVDDHPASPVAGAAS